MKKLFFFIVLICITSSVSAQSAAAKEKVKTLMKDEPKVKDHVLTDANVLYASLIDDGTRRDGFAEYLYYTLKGEGIVVYKVVIVKYGSQKDPKRDNAYGVKIGEFKL